MLSHFKRRVGVFTAVAVLTAFVPAVTTMSSAGAAPATTAISVVTDDATYLTCPASASIPSAGFTDTTSTDVDCIAYYGITKGLMTTVHAVTATQQARRPREAGHWPGVLRALWAGPPHACSGASAGGRLSTALR